MTKNDEYEATLEEIATILAWTAANYLVQGEKAKAAGEDTFVPDEEFALTAGAINELVDVAAVTFGRTSDQIQNDLALRMGTIDTSEYVAAIMQREKNLLH